MTPTSFYVPFSDGNGKVNIMKKTIKFVLSVLCACSFLLLAGCEMSFAVSSSSISSAVSDIASTPEPTAEPTSEVTPTPEPTSLPTMAPEDENELREMISSMSLEEKVGQMFFVRRPDDAVNEVCKYQFGGFILFGRDFTAINRNGVRDNIASYQECSRIPMLIGLDEEGGTVVRMSDNPAFCAEPYLSPRDLYDSGGMDSIAYVEKDKCSVFADVGINVNFAPVCDISQEPDDFMYLRSLGQDADTTSQFVSLVTGIYRERKIGSVLKHFPGYGNNVDTHTGVALDNRSYQVFQAKDFLPFEAGIQAGAPCVLVSHNIVSCLDEINPASLSPEWHRILREEMGFEGCVITDDLSMGAIQDFCNTDSAAVRAVQAGNDLLCCTDYPRQIPAVLAAVENGEISVERIEESVLRILKWKKELGLL